MSEQGFDPLWVAVVGMAGRYPGAGDVETFWRLVRDGVEGISTFEGEEDDAHGDPADGTTSVRAGGTLEGIDLFDAAFFDINPREAEVTDPQQRLLLEGAWQALENAGCDPEQFDGTIGVFAGVGMNTYFLNNIFGNPKIFRSTPRMQVQIGADKDYAATRVSYKLNLRGPSLCVQSACSTGLAAVHLACQSLQDYQCDLALAGGATVLVPQQTGYSYQEGDIYSPDGHCRPFDAGAAGTVPASGVGVVALRRLEDAYADGNRILAVVRGSALSNDGNAKVGFTAPGTLGQVAVISEALRAADVEPVSIGYVEAHGTGTALGDPIEVAALAQAFAADPRRGLEPTTGCALGSVKSNIGHADTAAGTAGLIKTVLALHHRQLPPSLHFTAPHPAIDFSENPFFVNSALRPWPAGETPRRAGVSSFGVGGTNAHVILEEAPTPAPSGPSRPWQLLLLTARDPTALEAVTERLADHLETRSELAFADLAHTSRAGRKAFAWGRAVVCRDREDALAVLRSRDPERLSGGTRPAAERPLVFLFPGQGSQDAGMARGLYESEPTFRRWFNRAAEGFLDHGLGIDLRTALDATELRHTDHAQAALFTVEFALVRLLEEWGLKPAAMAGHSLGEYVAACLAGVFDFGTALALVAARGRLMRRLPAGAMLSVALGERDLSARLPEHPEVDLAATNGPAFQVVSGPPEAVEAFAAELAADRLEARRLHTSHAFHSAMMEPILDEFEAIVARFHLQEPQIPFLSNLTGTWIEPTEATTPRYWARHLRQPVRFGDALTELFQQPEHLLLEVGPGRTLATLARRHSALPEGQLVLSTLRPGGGSGEEPEQDQSFLLRTLGRLWLAGARIDWRRFVTHEDRRLVDLPPYPLNRRRFWIDPPDVAPRPGASAADDAPAPTTAPEPVFAGHERPRLATTWVPPRDEAEEKIAGVWQEALGLEEIGIHDDFFELGGDSLLATQISRRVRQELQIDVSLLALFEQPTIAGMAAVVGAAAGTAAERAPRFEALPTVVPDLARRGDPFPLTDVQQAYWIGRSAAFDLGGVATHTYTEFEMPGFELEELNRAWRKIIARHEMLRAVILPEGRQQILLEVPPYEIQLLDLRDRSPEEAREELAALRERLSRQVLPSDRWPLFDLWASRTREGVYRIHFSFDLLIGDAWSWDILAREWQHFLTRPETALPPIELSFRDYVIAQREFEESALFSRDLAYWKQRLPTFPGAPELPLAVAPSSLAKPRFVRLANHLDAAAWASIKRRAAGRRLTPSGVLLAAFAEVLGAWSKRPHFAINLTLFHRLPLHPQVEDLIGDFTSLTLLEVDGEAAGPFAERAVRLQNQLWQDLDHRLVSGVRVLRELARFHGTSAQQMMMPVVFTSTLNMARDEDELTLDPTASSLQEEASEVDATREDPYGISQTPQVWIDHQVQEGAGALYYNWDVVEDLFPEGLLSAMFRTFTRFLHRLAADEEAWEEALPLKLPEEQLAGREEANATAGPVPDLLLHQPFFAHAVRCPETPAVICAGQTWSYAQVARRAHALALLLRERGARPEQLVAVTMEKGVEQVVAVLGILAAGAAYLPVDPELPAQRRHDLYSLGEVEIILTQSFSQEELSWPEEVAVIALDALEYEHIEPGAPPLEPVQGLDNLAYVIFTSGSTGQPKGVMIEHRAAMNTIEDLGARFALGPADRVLAVSSLSFDLSVWDIFGPLSVGGALVLPKAEGGRDPAHWSQLMSDHGVSLWNSVPALMDLLLDHAAGRVEGLSASLRLVLLSGDWIPVALPGRVRELVPAAEVVSLGGATEGSIWSIFHPIHETDPRLPSIPYGKALRNQGFHVLDHHLEPRPVWVPGELYIGGLGLARGYWRDAATTAKSFLTHPRTRERLYRTGDLGRFLPDGNIQFLGREDFQVKIRGYRVELGEIEAALNRLVGVRESVVLAHAKARGEKQLVAFYLPLEEQRQTSETLQDILREMLPSYMVPTRFLEIASWPLSANGKVDRAALDALVEGHEGATPGSVPPETELEELLMELCAGVLGQEIPGIHDDFFELGGDSLMAVRLILEIRREFDVEFPMRAFFESPTVADLAALIEEIILQEIEALPEDDLPGAPAPTAP